MTTPTTDRGVGLYRKYAVQRLGGTPGKHDACSYFVLDTNHDLYAAAALAAYSKACETAYPELAADIRLLPGVGVEAEAAAAEKARADDLQATFDLRWKADTRAIKAWQAAHPMSETAWPDHVDLVIWLAQRADALVEEVERLRTALDWTLPRLVPYSHPRVCSPMVCVCGYTEFRAALEGKPRG
jgi:hypothetical protein